MWLQNILGLNCDISKENKTQGLTVCLRQTTKQRFGRRKVAFEKSWCLLRLRIYLPENPGLALIFSSKMGK